MKTYRYPFFLSLLLFVGCLDSPGNNYNSSEDEAFLEEYAKREGVTTTNSGLMYRVIEEGEGESPDGDQKVIVYYTGESVKGDRQYTPQEPQEFEIFIPDQLNTFPGIGEGVQLMNEGARYELVIPSNLAEGNGRTYIFDMRLLSFLRLDQEQFLLDNAEREDVVETDSGLQFRVIEEGTGDQPGPADNVSLKYKGMFTNGFIFDESPEDETVTFSVAGVITGFSEGLQMMKEGGTYELFIPPSLGYGGQYPQINNVIIFEVELDEIQ